MKIYKKSECRYENGYIVNGDDVVVPQGIMLLIDKLEDDVQRARFLRENEAEPVREVPEFKRKSEHGVMMPETTPATPVLDLKIKTAERLLDELDCIELAERVNGYVHKMRPLFEFVQSESFVGEEHPLGNMRFDLPTVGNPLELTTDKLTGLIYDMFDIDPKRIPDEQE